MYGLFELTGDLFDPTGDLSDPTGDLSDPTGDPFEPIGDPFEPVSISSQSFILVLPNLKMPIERWITAGETCRNLPLKP